MTWFITYKPSYDTDFIDLSKDLQKQATQAHADLALDPVTPRGNTIKKLKGWDNVWRYRLGDTRLIYSVVPESQVVQLLAIGPPPAIYAANGTADQARWLAQQIWQAAQDLRLPVNAAAVLVPSNRLGKAFAVLLNDHGLPAKFVSGKNIHVEERTVKVLTLHSAKGLEFPIVALAHIEADRIPKETDATDAQDIAEHHYAQRRLMYVGFTRAMRYLFVTHDKSIPSPFLEQLSEDCWLWL